jgi:hypothetical protein
MATYVTSLHGNAPLAHIGYPITACGKSFIAAFQTSDNGRSILSSDDPRVKKCEAPREDTGCFATCVRLCRLL